MIVPSALLIFFYVVFPWIIVWFFGVILLRYAPSRRTVLQLLLVFDVVLIAVILFTAINRHSLDLAYHTIGPTLAGLGWYLISRGKLDDDQRPPHPICPTCGYNLTGNKSGACPECGALVVKN